MSQIFKQLTKEEVNKYLEVCLNVSEKEMKEVQILKKAGQYVDLIVSRIRDIDKVLMRGTEDIQMKHLLKKRNECIDEIDSLQKALDLDLGDFLPNNTEGYDLVYEYNLALKKINSAIKKREDSIGLLELVRESLINRLNQDAGFNSQDFSNNKTC